MRLKKSSKAYLLKNNDGSTAADSVEVFAPVIFEAHAPTKWPKVLSLDAAPASLPSKASLRVQRVSPCRLSHP